MFPYAQFMGFRSISFAYKFLVIGENLAFFGLSWQCDTKDCHLYFSERLLGVEMFGARYQGTTPSDNTYTSHTFIPAPHFNGTFVHARTHIYTLPKSSSNTDTSVHWRFQVNTGGLRCIKLTLSLTKGTYRYSICIHVIKCVYKRTQVYTGDYRRTQE